MAKKLWVLDETGYGLYTPQNVEETCLAKRLHDCLPVCSGVLLSDGRQLLALKVVEERWKFQ